MLQKIVAALITAGLAAQSCISLEQPAPSFSWTSNKNAQHETLTVNTDAGTFVLHPNFCNASAWSFVPSNGSPTIEQKTLFSIFLAEYGHKDIQASVGDNKNVRLYLSAKLNTTTHTLSLTAKANGTQCNLEPKFSSPQMDFHLDVVSSNEAFKTPAVLQELKSAVSKTLADALPAFLTEFVRPLSKKTIDKDALCKQILAAMPGSFPEPELSSSSFFSAYMCRTIQ